MVFVIGMFAPFYAVFVEKIGGNIAWAGFSWAILSIVTGVLILLFTNLEVKVKEQELLLALGYILRGAVFVSYAFMGSLTQLLFTQVLWGIAAAIGVPAFDAVYQSHTSQEEAIGQWGGWEGISSIATGIAALLGGLLIQSFGYNVVFIGMAGISFMLGLYVWRLPREVL
jgi:sugar phosphate permease